MTLKDEGTVKIRQNGLKLDTPQRWHFHQLKTDIVFDVDGTAEVPGRIAEKLLGPAYKGTYSLVGVVEQPSEQPRHIDLGGKEEAPKQPVIKPRAKVEAVKPPQVDETTEFVKEII